MKTQDAAPDLSVTSLANGEAKVFRTHGMYNITIVTAAGATATHSTVDSEDATAHDAVTGTVAAATKGVIPCDWPWTRVSVSGGACRVAVLP